MAYLISFPVLIIVLMLQLAIFSQLPLLSGTPDLVLLVLIAWSLHEKSQKCLVLGGGWRRVSEHNFRYPIRRAAA